MKIVIATVNTSEHSFTRAFIVPDDVRSETALAISPQAVVDSVEVMEIPGVSIEVCGDEHAVLKELKAMVGIGTTRITQLPPRRSKAS